MRIGIVPPDNPSAGGIYQYGLTMLQTLKEYKEGGCEDEFSLFSFAAPPCDILSIDPAKWLSETVPPPPVESGFKIRLRNLIGQGPHFDAWRWLRRAMTKRADEKRDEATFRCMNDKFRASGVELLVYPFPSPLAFRTQIPYVMAIHDLQHRLQPEFPEVSADGEWEFRENIYQNGIRNATLLIADSEVGKEDILNCYGVSPDRVKVLPFLPASYLATDVTEKERKSIRIRYALPERYLFYPAQFWPHKNHKRIVQAMGLLKKTRGLAIKAVFCGSHTQEIRERTFQDVMAAASAAGIAENIQYLGYVPNRDISAIYAEATGLVMPTFFGPTNIPVLEAWALECPVLSSDIRGIREQIHNAGILVDPRSVESIADGIHKLWTEDSLRAELARRGVRRLATYTPASYRQRLIEILEESKLRVGHMSNLRLQSI